MRPKTVNGVTRPVFTDQDRKVLDNAISVLVQYRMCDGDLDFSGETENTLRKLQELAMKDKPGTPG